MHFVRLFSFFVLFCFVVTMSALVTPAAWIDRAAVWSALCDVLGTLAYFLSADILQCGMMTCISGFDIFMDLIRCRGTIVSKAVPLARMCFCLSTLHGREIEAIKIKDENLNIFTAVWNKKYSLLLFIFQASVKNAGVGNEWADEVLHQQSYTFIRSATKGHGVIYKDTAGMLPVTQSWHFLLMLEMAWLTDH